MSAATGPHLVAVAVNVPRVADAEVRTGIDAAIDRVRFDEVVLREEGAAAASVLASGRPGYVSAWDPAGGSSPPALAGTRELDLIFARGELIDLTARYVQEEVRAAGGDIELVPLEVDVYHELFLKESRFDLALVEVRTGPSPELWRWTTLPGTGKPVTGLDDEELARLAEAVEGGDPNAGKSLGEFQERLADLAAVIPLYHPATTVAWRDGVNGLEANPTVEGPLWNAWAWSVVA